jgi:lysophospholipid acyltransferase (LPLAT)-like uncharacterized protein
VTSRVGGRHSARAAWSALTACLRTALGFVLGLIVRSWLATLNVAVHVADERALAAPEPLVLAFWHGQQMALCRWPRRKQTLVMVSWSRDGDLQAGVMRALGLAVVRGSSSRGGGAALRRVIRALGESACDAAFAVDGPRGPRGRAKSGAAEAARLARARLVPMAVAVERARVVRRAWDRFEVPLPFSRIQIVLGAPLDVERARHEPEWVDRSIDAARREAVQRLTRSAKSPALVLVAPESSAENGEQATMYENVRSRARLRP